MWTNSILEEGDKRRRNRVAGLVFAPGNKMRWYTPSPIEVTVPVEHLLHTGFQMEPAAPPAPPARATAMQNRAIAAGALVLSEEDHLQGMDSLAYN